MRCSAEPGRGASLERGVWSTALQAQHVSGTGSSCFGAFWWCQECSEDVLVMVVVVVVAFRVFAVLLPNPRLQVESEPELQECIQFE